MSDDTKSRFIRQLAMTGNVTTSAEAVGVARHMVYEWRKQDPSFARKWEDALAIAVDALAMEARRRALDGVEEVRYFHGEPIGTIRKYSDQLLMFLLRAYDPETFISIRDSNRRPTKSAKEIRDQIQAKIDRLVDEGKP
ncbi:MAG: terminase [Proteobacteria bacterium]|nr:terminase [Pseudomonadota bacterium]